MSEKTLSKAAIQREREMLQKRLADLDAAERVLNSIPAVQIESLKNADSIEQYGPMPSIKQLILFEAHRDQRGTSPSEIADVIRCWIPDYPAKNISPKLSLYKSEGLLKLADGRWFATDKGIKEFEKSKN